MSTPVIWMVLLVLLFFSGVFSGSETGFYRVSRVRVQVDARAGNTRARIMRWLLERDTAVLITILIGNNLMLELATHVTEDVVGGWQVPDYGRELVVTLCLTPLVFIFGELLPKELFRRRPYALFSRTAPVIAAARWLFLPLERVIAALTYLINRLFGVEGEALRRVLDRENVLRLFRESAESGTIMPDAENLARNVLRLNAIPVRDVMIPWAEVESLALGAPGAPGAPGVPDTRGQTSNAELYEGVARSSFSRLPVVAASGEVTGYTYQLDVLSKGSGVDVLDDLRSLKAIPSDTAVGHALERMRKAGLRMVVVGTLAEPEGLLTLKDLVEKVSGDLGAW